MHGAVVLGQALAAARRPEFRFLWLANGLANYARWFELAVLTWLALGLTGSPWDLAVIGFWRNIPLLALGAFGGLLADLFDRRSLAVVTQLASAVVTSGLAWLLLTDQIAPWHLVASSLILGLIAAVDWPCRRALVMDMVARQDVVNGAALDGATTMIARILGPFLAGVFIALLGVGLCYVLLTLAYVAAGVAALGMRRVPPQGRAGFRSAVESLGEGVRYTVGRPAILALIAVSFFANLFSLPFLQFLPVFARDVLGLDPVRYGSLGSMVGAGALASTLALAVLARRSRPSAAFVFGAILMGLGLVPFALTTSYAVALLCLFVVGCGQGLYASLQGPSIMLRADASVRGRVMGLLIVAIGFWPIGMLIMGALIAGLGPSFALAAEATVYVAALCVLAAWRPEFFRDAARPSAAQRESA